MRLCIKIIYSSSCVGSVHTPHELPLQHALDSISKLWDTHPADGSPVQCRPGAALRLRLQRSHDHVVRLILHLHREHAPGASQLQHLGTNNRGLKGRASERRAVALNHVKNRVWGEQHQIKIVSGTGFRTPGT